MPITPIPAAPDTLYAFQISGTVTAEEMEAMAATMNEAFDRHETVDMLLRFAPDFEGSETGASMNWETMKSHMRSLANVERYVTVGAPEAAGTMVETMGAVIPVECKAFEASREAEAWAFVDGKPLEHMAA